MKSEGLHKGKSRAINLGADARKKSSRETFQGGSASLKTMSVAEGAVMYSTGCCTQSASDGKPQLLRTLERHHAAKKLRARSQRDHFPQHSQAIAKKADFATLSVVPAHRNFTDSQSGMLRQIKQFDIKGEPVEAGGLQNRTAHIETKSLEPALRVPKRQPSRDADEQVERAPSLLASPRLMDANQSAIQGARP